MNRLIKFEFRKLFKSRYFYVVAAISIVFILISGITSSVLKAYAESQGQPFTVTGYTFARQALGGTFSMLIGVFVAVAATEDNSMGTMKNVVARGYSRIKIFFAKYIVSYLGVLMISALSVGVAAIYGNIAFGVGGIEPHDLVISIFGQLIGLLAYHALYFAISSGFGKIGPAIAVSLIGPMSVTLICNLLDTVIRIEDAKIGKYWIEQLFASFTTGDSTAIRLWISFGLLVVYFAVSLGIGFLINRKREY